MIYDLSPVPSSSGGFLIGDLMGGKQETGGSGIESELSNDVADTNSETFCNLYQIVERRTFNSSFNTGDENCRKIRFFGELFLGQPNLSASGSDGSSEQLPMTFCGRHSSIKMHGNPSGEHVVND